MKKSVILMAGLMAMALAGSAQAATMFAVQDAGSNDKMVVTDAGWVGIGSATPIAPFHVVSAGTTVASAGFNYTFTNTGALAAFKAPNFTFYRNNNGTGTQNPNDATLPRANDTLGVLQFGSLVGASGALYASIAAKAEVDASATVNSGYIALSTTNGLTLAEKLRVTSVGNVGVGTTAPTSKLQVVGLPVCPDNTTAKTATPTGCGLTAGAFYLQGPVGGPTTTGAVFVAF